MQPEGFCFKSVVAILTKNPSLNPHDITGKVVNDHTSLAINSEGSCRVDHDHLGDHPKVRGSCGRFGA